METPPQAREGDPVQVTGIAQVGVSGLSKVQYAVTSRGHALPEDNPDFPAYTAAEWRDAEILPPPSPAEWAAALPGGAWPDVPLQFDGSGVPRTWPLRYTICHWAAQLPPLAPGAYDLRCRTVDQNGHVQPMPRPFPKGGRADIQTVPLEVVP